MIHRHSAANKETFEKYVRERFTGWSIKEINTLQGATPTFPGRYEAILVAKKPKLNGRWEVYSTFDDKMDAMNSVDDFKSMGTKAKMESIDSGYAVYQFIENDEEEKPKSRPKFYDDDTDSAVDEPEDD